MQTRRIDIALAVGLFLFVFVGSAISAQPANAQQGENPMGNDAFFNDFFSVSGKKDTNHQQGNAAASQRKPPQLTPEGAKAKAEQKHRMEEIEAKQPPAVRRDKYMISLSRLLKEQKYAESLPYFDKMDELPVKKDPLLDYYHGEALYNTDKPQLALQMFYRYIETQGSNAPRYQDALNMIIKIEQSQQ